MAGIFKVDEVLDFVGSALEPVWLLPILVAVVVAIVAALRYAFKTSIYPGTKEAKSSKGSLDGSTKKRKRTRLEEKSAGDALKNNTNKASVKAKSTRKVLTTEQKPSTSKPVAAVDGAKKESTAVVNAKGNTKVANNKKAVNDKKAQLAATSAKVAGGKKMANTKEVKSAAKNMEKPLDHTGNDGGEWQTVITKKQKKTIIDLLAQAEAKVVVNEVAKSADDMSTNVKDVDVSTTVETTKKSHETSHSSSSSSNNSGSNNNNNKEAKEQANKTKKASYDQQKQQETNIEAAPTFTVDNKIYEEQLIGTPSAVIEVNADAADRGVAASNTATVTANVDYVPVADPVVASVPVAADAPIESAVVFDELGDSIWTEAKAPRKSKKRAHRE